MKPRLLTLFALAPLLLSVCEGSHAHPVSLSEAIVDIHQDHIGVKIKILIEDFYLYQDLTPTEEGYLTVDTLKQAMETHKPFLTEFFQIRDLDGLPMPIEFQGMTAQDLPEEGVHIANLMQFFVEYEIRVPLQAPPQFLTFLQQFGGEDSFLPATMWFSLLREGAPMFRPFMLPKDIPFAIDIDWSAPPPPPDASPEEASEYFERENERKLGFTSYGAVYSFFYITEFEVRHEILIPLLTLESWMPIPRKDSAFIEVEEQQAVRDNIFAYFRDRNPVEVDGIAVKPTMENIVFYGLDFSDFAQQAPEKRLSAYTARVGIILNYSTKGTPNAVKLTWEMFNNYVPVLYSMIYSFEHTDQKVFTRREPIFEWMNPGRETPEAIVELAAPVPARTLEDSEAGGVFATLHRNMYRAFDYRNESDIYDALEKSIAGDLLATLYLQIRKSLEMQEQGGAVSRIKSVKIVDTTRLTLDDGDPKRAFVMQCTWQVEGSVEHWGHIHTRTNQYVARFRLEALENGWRITAMDVDTQERIKFETGLRTLPS